MDLTLLSLSIKALSLSLPTCPLPLRMLSEVISLDYIFEYVKIFLFS